MNFDKPPQPTVKSDLTEEEMLSRQIRKLASGSTSLKQVAELLDAEEFLVFDYKKNGWNFNAQGFIKKRIKEGSLIKLPESFKIIPEVILAPGSGEIIPGSGTGIKEKRIIPRSRFLMELLTEVNLDYQVIEGNNDSKMMRQLSYKVFIVTSLNMILLVNDEEGNATFVIYSAPDSFEEVKKLIVLSKESLESQKNVETVNYTGDEVSWKLKIKLLLQQYDVSRESSLTTQQGIYWPYKPRGYWENASIEEIKKEIERRGLDPKNIPVDLGGKDGNAGLRSGLEKRFGTLTEARRVFGGKVLKKPDGYWQNISIEDLREEIKSRGLVPNNLPSSSILKEENIDLRSGLRKRFGSLSKARKMLGSRILERPKGYWRNLPIEQVIEEIKSVGLDPKNLPGQQDMYRDYPYLAIGIYRRFGGLEKARLALGGQLKRKPVGYWANMDLQQLREEIKKRGIDPNNIPPAGELRQKGHEDLLQALSKRFGYKKAREILKEGA